LTSADYLGQRGTSGAVYLVSVQDGKKIKQHINSADAMNACNFNWGNIKTNIAEIDTLPTGEPIPATYDPRGKF
jgi:hypothetical protein